MSHPAGGLPPFLSSACQARQGVIPYGMADDAPISIEGGDYFPPAVNMRNQPNVSGGEIWDALVASGGNIGAAARALGLPRYKVQERIDRNVDLQRLLSDMREEVVDSAESNHFIRAKSGADPAAERFVLQTLGKHRGWNSAVGGMNGSGDIVVTIKKFSEDENAEG